MWVRGLQNKILNTTIHWLCTTIFRKFRIPTGGESLSTLVHWPLSHIKQLWVKPFLSLRPDLESNGEPFKGYHLSYDLRE